MPQQLRAALLHHHHHHLQPTTTPAFLLQPTLSLPTRTRILSSSSSLSPTPSATAAFSTDARETSSSNDNDSAANDSAANENNTIDEGEDADAARRRSVWEEMRARRLWFKKKSPTEQPLPLVPEPTPFVPDVQTFLTLIGRGLGQHASKFPSWESLFTLSSEQLRELGIEPPRTRRYLLQWRQRFRRRHYGVAGDLLHVQNGVAELRILNFKPPEWGEGEGEVEGEVKGEVKGQGEAEGRWEGEGFEEERGEYDVYRRESQRAKRLVFGRPAAAFKQRYVVNVPAGTTSVKKLDLSQMSRVKGYKVRGARTIVGPYALPIKIKGPHDEGGARITVTEGMWEMRRGRKIDGGERRRTEVRYKKRIALRRELREQGQL